MTENYTVRLQDHAGRHFEIRISALSEAQAREIARRTYPTATVLNAFRS